MADQPISPPEHDQSAPAGQSAPSGQGMFGAIGSAATGVLNNVDFAGAMRQASEGILNTMPGLEGLLHVEAVEHAASEAAQNGVEAGMDAVMAIPDDGYDYVDAELVVADAGDDQAHEAEAVASHDHDGAGGAHDVGYDA